MKPWHDYTQTIASIAQSFVNVCQNVMTNDQVLAWAKNELSPNDCMDASLVMDSIIENHGVIIWSDGYMSDEAIRFFNQCCEAAEKLNKELTK
jgi:hypothetical protein